MPGYIHHVEWCISDLQHQLKTLVTHFGFRPIGQRTRKVKNAVKIQQVAVQSGKTIFVLTQKRAKEDLENILEKDDTELPILVCCPDQEHQRDSVFNVALKVDKIDDILQKLTQEFILERNSKFAVIKSCCGNVIHTLLEEDLDLTNAFKEPIEMDQVWPQHSLCTTHMDHVTYVCHQGQSQKILAWYGDLFKMQRFLVNSRESEENGVTIPGEVNMRLMVGQWLSSWLCREEGVQSQENQELNFKLVLAEPLDDSQDSHVKNFLSHHGGPGLQHIGLTTPNATQTVQIMSTFGARFRKPPPTYYQLESKVREILDAGEDLKVCADLGLLFDAEADFDSANKYLVQIFTKPMFPGQDTFFLEVLERRGAKGFGSGNITALAQSIILYQQQQQKYL